LVAADSTEGITVIILGIDIGLTGAISRLGMGLEARIVDIPTIPDGEPRQGRGKALFRPQRIHGRQLLDLLRELVPAGHVALAVFEDVRARPMHNDRVQFNSFHSQNSLVLSRGVIQAVLDVAGFKAEAVQPQTWKRMYGLGGADKADSLEMARSLYPGLSTDLKRMKDHNRAESLLLAHYGLRKLA
jgi:hypothetical protein